jgi:hypothetical protein
MERIGDGYQHVECRITRYHRLHPNSAYRSRRKHQERLE